MTYSFVTSECSIYLPEVSKGDLRAQSLEAAADVLRCHGWYVASLHLRRMRPDRLRIVAKSSATRLVSARLAEAGAPERSLRRCYLRYAASRLRSDFPDEAEFLEHVAADDGPRSYVRTGRVSSTSALVQAHPNPPASSLSELQLLVDRYSHPRDLEDDEDAREMTVVWEIGGPRG